MLAFFLPSPTNKSLSSQKKCSVILIHPIRGREQQFFSFSAFFSLAFVFFSAFFSKRRASRDVAAFSRRFLPLDREKVETFAGETRSFFLLRVKLVNHRPRARHFSRAHKKDKRRSCIKRRRRRDYLSKDDAPRLDEAHRRFGRFAPTRWSGILLGKCDSVNVIE